MRRRGGRLRGLKLLRCEACHESAAGMASSARQLIHLSLKRGRHTNDVFCMLVSGGPNYDWRMVISPNVTEIALAFGRTHQSGMPPVPGHLILFCAAVEVLNVASNICPALLGGGTAAERQLCHLSPRADPRRHGSHVRTYCGARAQSDSRDIQMLLAT
jgi:hypothetical protein